MHLAKKLYCDIYNQLRCRKNLYHLRDRRARAWGLGPVLVQAAMVWPEVLPCKPSSILDIGAHRGDVAEELAQLYHPQFIGLIEPLPQMATLLRRRIFAGRQMVFQCALGNRVGTANLNVLASPASSSLLEVMPGCDILFKRSMDKVETVPVPIRTLDDIFDECRLSQLDLLKIDVQGYELEVFAGGSRALAKTRIIVCEVSFFEHYKGQPLFFQIYEFLLGAGFELRCLFNYIYDGQGFPLQCDAVFMNRSLRTVTG